MSETPPGTDSQRRQGGRIPGTPDTPAYWLNAAEPSPLPVLIAVPHAGRAYPGPLLHEMRSPEQTALKLEDRYVDLLGKRVASETGASLLVADAPRAMIDLNRAPNDVDWDMFGRADRPEGFSFAASSRARSGLGLIPRRVPGIGELWKKRLVRAELAERVNGIHEPYHAALAETLAALRERWGAALLIDLHSMPPINPRGLLGAPQVVIGDRFGAAAQGSLVAAAFSYLGGMDRAVSHNRPYAGGYVLERHARPSRGLHAIQLEIDRSIYLDPALDQPGRGLDDTVAMLCGLVRRLASETANLGESRGDLQWPEAAQ